jgi:hypothetical protein
MLEMFDSDDYGRRRFNLVSTNKGSYMRLSIFEFRKMLIEFQEFAYLYIWLSIEQTNKLFNKRLEVISRLENQAISSVEETDKLFKSETQRKPTGSLSEKLSPNEQPDLKIAIKDLSEDFKSVSSSSEEAKQVTSNQPNSNQTKTQSKMTINLISLGQ